MAKKTAKKVGKKKPKPKLKQKQKQKQSQKTSVTVNINTEKKRKAPRATNGNTNRVLQQFAQPIITLPSNLINPPPMPQYGLNPSQLQTRRNDGEAGSFGQPLRMAETLRAGFPLQNIQDPYEQSLSGFSLSPDSLRNYDEPEKAYTASLSSGFSVASSASPTIYSSSGLTGSSLSPSSIPSRASTSVKSTYLDLPTPPPVKTKKRIKLKIRPSTTSIGGLSTEPQQKIGVPKAGNPSLMTMLPQRPETTRMINESIPSVEGKLGDY